MAAGRSFEKQTKMPGTCHHTRSRFRYGVKRETEQTTMSRVAAALILCRLLDHTKRTREGTKPATAVGT